ncbi:MAG: tRNA dihydrouridine synthase DusB [Burkholderiales bacterium]
MRIGTHVLKNNLFVAPMAGVTDRPFRQLCKRFGAGLAVSEMVASNELTWNSTKTQLRTNHDGEVTPISVQIAGADPAMMARAAVRNVEAGAQIIDINMGCPVKKVCNTMAGSALLRDEALVARILEAVVRAVEVPVTLKYRTGWDAANKNAIRIAHIAQESGIHLLALHGRTRACGFQGRAEYETIAEVKAHTRLPVIANGDINTPDEAKHVLALTQADGIMIGRAAQGRPWIFREIAHYLATGQRLPPPAMDEIREVIVHHLHALHEFYGRGPGVRIARKHIAWYTKALLRGTETFRERFNRLESCEEQHQAIAEFFGEYERNPGQDSMRLCHKEERLAA